MTDTFKTYVRTGSIEARPWTEADAKSWRETAQSSVSISEADRIIAGWPEAYGMVARNPENHADQWYIAPSFFAKNYREGP